MTILGGRTDEIEGVIVATTSSYVAIGKHLFLLIGSFFVIPFSIYFYGSYKHNLYENF